MEAHLMIVTIKTNSCVFVGMEDSQTESLKKQVMKISESVSFLRILTMMQEIWNQEKGSNVDVQNGSPSLLHLMVRRTDQILHEMKMNEFQCYLLILSTVLTDASQDVHASFYPSVMKENLILYFACNDVAKSLTSFPKIQEKSMIGSCVSANALTKNFDQHHGGMENDGVQD